MQFKEREGPKNAHFLSSLGELRGAKERKVKNCAHFLSLLRISIWAGKKPGKSVKMGKSGGRKEEPCGVKAVRCDVVERGGRVCIAASFGRDEVLGAITEDGDIEIEVVGRLDTGQWFCGQGVLASRRGRNRQTHLELLGGHCADEFVGLSDGGVHFLYE
jgi:hypothetical protein